MKSDISHVQSFKEFPTGNTLTLKMYNDFIDKQGKVCESQEDIVAGVKGQLDQRAKRAKKM